MKHPLIGLAALLLTSCGDAEPPANQNSIAMESASKPDPQAVFQRNCASCHNMLKDATGPALSGVIDRWNQDTAKMKAFIRNPQEFYGKDPHVDSVHQRYHSMMTPFPNLSEAELDALIAYLGNASV